MKKIAFVTGATSGIGLAIARELADTYSLIICGRRKERLESIKKELEAKTEVWALPFDVSDHGAVVAAFDSLPSEWKEINLLINNAGNAHGRSPLHEGDIADWDAMIDSNLKGLLYVSRTITPGMVARRNGDVINISSIAGKEAYENGNVYCATKFGVDALTKSMRHELIKHNIRVTSINPGAVNTDFSLVRFKGDQLIADSVYDGFDPLLAKDIAEAVKFVVERPTHVAIADMTILARAQSSATSYHKE
ncbi:MAG: SDR family NAD(P)-dependent oxidoreductase [Reichenbachiella sp.]